MELEELRAGMTHPGGAWTQAATWYSDDQKLVAVSARGHRHRAIDLLAFGLQRLEGRELHLVVPLAAVNPTRARAAFRHGLTRTASTSPESSTPTQNAHSNWTSSSDSRRNRHSILLLPQRSGACDISSCGDATP
jgi:hypothetical protein